MEKQLLRATLPEPFLAQEVIPPLACLTLAVLLARSVGPSISLCALYGYYLLMLHQHPALTRHRKLADLATAVWPARRVPPPVYMSMRCFLGSLLLPVPP